MTLFEYVDCFSKGIATMEGFYHKDSRAQRNNNPGNLRNWTNAKVSNGYALFDTPEAGWLALKMQIHKNVVVRRLTLREFFGGKKGVYAGYAPAADSNHPVHYAVFIFGKLQERFGDALTLKSIDDLPPHFS